MVRISAKSRTIPTPDAEQRPDARTDQPPSMETRGAHKSASKHGMHSPASRHRIQQSASRHRSHQTIYRRREMRPPSSRPQLTSHLQRPDPRRSWWYSKHQWPLGIRRQTTSMPDGRPISRQLKRPSVNLLQPRRERLQGNSSNREANTSSHASSPRRAPLNNYRGLLLDIFICRPAVRPPEMNINTIKVHH